MSATHDWMRPADESILAFLDRAGPEMEAFVASRTGTHLPHTRKRCGVLERRGFVRRLDDSRLALTNTGERHLLGDATETVERAAEAD